ncbi:type III effector protein, AvrPphF family (plasmid) [Ralstonia solanacearum]|nr:type III effector protein, AvrPphF family [Ralstonia solanacearum]
MGFPRIPSIFRPSPTASPDTHHASPTRTPPHETPRQPKSRGLGVLRDLPRFVRSKLAGTSSSTAGPAVGAPPPASPPQGFRLPRQNALNAEGVRAFGQDFPRPSPPSSGHASTSNPPPVRTLAEQLVLREQILARQPCAISVASSPRYIPVEALEPALRKAYLERFDPVNALGLTDRSVFYRALDNCYLLADGRQMRLAGNAKSGAYINHHLQLRPTVALADKARFEMLPAAARERMLEDPLWQYESVSMRAQDLPDPTLNVLFGQQAEQGARSYAKTGNHVVVSMTLGDLRKAGGGQVFLDTRAAMRNDSTQALIVTLPAGETVPVKIVPAGQPGASTSRR